MSQVQPPEVFIIILNWENISDTIECLESVFQLCDTNFQVVICDNASTDDSVRLLNNWLAEHHHPVGQLDESELENLEKPLDSKVVIIRNHKNYGYAGGNNRGLSYALTSPVQNGYAWIINNDAVLDPEALSALRAAAEHRPDVSFFGSTILDYRQRDRIQTQGGDHFYPWFGMSHHIGEGRNLSERLSQAEVEGQLSYVVGASVFVRLKAIRQLGLMEERYFLYFEEIDWATRAHRHNMKFGYVPKSMIYHKEGGSIGSSAFARRKSLTADYYGVKNRIVMTRKLFAWFLPTVYLAMLFTLGKRIFTFQFDRAWMVVLIMLGLDHRPK